jgi:hypothetical protein
MAFNIGTTLDNITSHISASGYVNDVQVGEPISVPDANDRIFVGVWMTSASVVEVTLSTTVEIHITNVRLYKRAALGQGDDSGDVEKDLALAVSQISSDLIGEYDLGGSVRNIDMAGQYSEGMTATWGYVQIAQTVFRMVDLVVPLIVDDSASQAA